MRGRLGDLTEGEAKLMASDYAEFLITLCRAVDIPLDTPKERLDHSILLDRFAAAETTNMPKLPIFTRLQVSITRKLIRVAMATREARLTAWSYSKNKKNMQTTQDGRPSTAASPLSAHPWMKNKKGKSGKRKPQNPTGGEIHEALLVLFHKNPKAVHYSAQRLADILKSRRKNPLKRCSASGVKATQAWHQYCVPLRRREKTVSLEDAGQIKDNQSDRDEPSEQSETDQD